MAEIDKVLIACRMALRVDDDAECLRRFDTLVKAYGATEVSTKWQQACDEFDRENEHG